MVKHQNNYIFCNDEKLAVTRKVGVLSFKRRTCFISLAKIMLSKNERDE